MICSRWTVSNLLELLDPSMKFKSKNNIYKIFHEEKQEKAETVPKKPKTGQQPKKRSPTKFDLSIKTSSNKFSLSE